MTTHTPAPIPKGSLLTAGQILSLPRHSNMTADEALRFGRAIETALLSKLRAPVAELQWSEVTEPNEQIRYTHVLAESPLGRFTIEWKSWKPHDTFCVYLDGDYLDTSMGLDDAKAIALKKVSDMARALAGFAALASAPVAGEAISDVNILGLAGQYIQPREPESAPQILNFARALLSRYAAPQASEAVRDAAQAVRYWDKWLHASNDDDEANRSETDATRLAWTTFVISMEKLRALSAQPGAQKGGSDAE